MRENNEPLTHALQKSRNLGYDKRLIIKIKIIDRKNY